MGSKFDNTTVNNKQCTWTSVTSKDANEFNSVLYTLQIKKTASFYFCNNLVKPFYIWTKKCSNCECIATWGRPMSHQSFSALIMKLCQVRIRWTYPLPYYRFFAANTLLWPWPLTLWPWLRPMTVNICSISSVMWWNSVRNVNAIQQSAASLLWFQYLT